MARLLLNLRHVPEDEADDIRALLDRHGFAYFETPPNRWGISVGGIWLRDEEDFEAVQTVLARYQAERAERARAAYAADRRAGRAETLLQRLRRDPLRSLALLAAVALVLYLTLMPFLTLGG
ncbi:DUF6164 family protein [Spiribacter halobius]|uniref:Uncharacterized protein n=1 Tax=Sediminicurvatus halobius TaxID=2182432 RepID=A0A2U2N924_9GAMM|nr:DUF6164 family protein [Spiribacter halobius]PWG65484.1 hypothetical protein DEM34_01715 [Spiribacter halobius]UEX76507.1 DUF6164 family protein [Spiribacter halobius]